jgi:hypothetical protein
MDARFDEEFYKSSWQRVLPLGPDGIQPYVRASRPSRLPGVPADMARLIATLDTLAQGVIRVRTTVGERRGQSAAAVGERTSRAAPATMAPARARSGAPDCAPNDAAPAQSGFGSQNIRAPCAGLAERTETIMRARGHHRETHGDYAATQIRQQWCLA